MSLDSGTDFTTFCPDIDMSMESAWRLMRSQFGDGYEQRILDGLNALNRTWSVSYSNRAETTIALMLSVLTGAQGGALPFKDPASGEVVQVFADEWSVTWEQLSGGAPRGALSVEFRNANGAKVVVPTAMQKAVA